MKAPLRVLEREPIVTAMHLLLDDEPRLRTVLVMAYRRWQKEDAGLHPFDRRRRGYATLARTFGVSIHVARHAVAYAR